MTRSYNAGIPLKFLSLDQKPSWFNNSGHTSTYAKRGEQSRGVWENYASMLQRYTILTTVPSWCQYPLVDADPPHVFVLFKGKKRGTIIQKLLSSAELLPPWFHIQVQEFRDFVEYAWVYVRD